MALIDTGFSAGLQAALNQFLALDPRAKSRFQALAGKVLAIQLQDLRHTLFFIPTAEDVQIFSHYDGKVDTEITGSSLNILMMATSQQPGDNLFKGSVKISGDTQLGQDFQDILRSVDIDWEEHLASITGDIVAHKVGNAVRGIMAWGQQSMRTLQQDISEYVHYETQLAPTDFEIQEFNQAVDSVRDAVERIAARVDRLAKKLESKRAPNISKVKR